MSIFVRQNSAVASFRNSESWTINSDIEAGIKEKIDNAGIPLKDWDISIYRGILTGCNEAFIIDGKTRAELIQADPKSDQIIRPILRGRDLKRYSCNLEDIWLINMHNGVKEKGIKRIEVDDYPAIKNHLDQFYTNLEKRADKGDTPYNLRNCAYIDDFSKQKIVWGNLNLKASYTIAPEGVFVNAPCPLIVPANKYLLAVLNSKLADYYIRGLGVTRNGGYFEYKPMFVEKLPVPIISNYQQDFFEKLVDAIQATEDPVSSQNLQSEIDDMIFKIYELSEEEIEFIKST